MGKKLKGRKSPNGFAKKKLTGKIKKIITIGDNNKVHLWERDQLIKFLKFSYWNTYPNGEKFTIESIIKDGVELPSYIKDHDEFFSVLEFISRKFETSDHLYDYRPIQLMTSNTYANPVGVFDDVENDRTLYIPLKGEEYFDITGIDTKHSSPLNKPKRDNREIVFTGCTPINTFKLPVDQIPFLEEILPINSPSLDELISLGQLDEDIQPFKEERLQGEIDHLRKMIGKKRFKQFYRHDDKGELMVRVTHTNGVTGYHPMKTKKHWSEVVGSVPIKEENGKIYVPMLGVKETWEVS